VSRLAILSLVLLAGCSPVEHDLRPLVAVAGTYSLLANASPKPEPSAKCKSCRGTGKVGDGVVSSKCARCDGTGVEPKSVLVPINCKDGKCSTSR
jgi:hypothetical protein